MIDQMIHIDKDTAVVDHMLEMLHSSSRAQRYTPVVYVNSEVAYEHPLIELQSTTVHELTHSVNGEDFLVVVDCDVISLVHPTWSLSGEGETLLDAENDLLEEARDIFTYYASRPVGSFTPDALSLRDYLLSVV